MRCSSGALWLAFLLTMVTMAGCLAASPSESEIPDAGETVLPEPLMPASNASTDPASDASLGRTLQFTGDGSKEIIQLQIPSFDDHVIYATVHKPTQATAETPVPLLLHSHGFTGSRTQGEGSFLTFMEQGFAVVSFDERGHGDSFDDSTVQFMNPEFEVRDIQILITALLEEFDWIAMEDADDPWLGALGGSYGGAYQIMGAIFDDRFDAIAPDIAWYDITEALAPNGVPKTGWIGLFYVAGNALQSAAFGPEFHIGFTWVQTTNTLPEGQLGGTIPDLVALFDEGSHLSYPGELNVPVFYTQGIKDTLFTLNQVVSNYEQSLRNGQEAYLYTHNSGHVLDLGSLGSPIDFGLQSGPGGYPCGELPDLNGRFYEDFFFGLDRLTNYPKVCLALDDESTLVADAFPIPEIEARTATADTVLEIQIPAGVSSQLSQGIEQLEVPILTAEEDLIIAGIPTLTGTVTCGADCITFWYLTRDDRTGYERILNDQIMPLRFGTSAGQSFAHNLTGVTTFIPAGATLTLEVANFQDQYALNGGRNPDVALFENLEVTVPVLKASDRVTLEQYLNGTANA